MIVDIRNETVMRRFHMTYQVLNNGDVEDISRLVWVYICIHMSFKVCVCVCKCNVYICVNSILTLYVYTYMNIVMRVCPRRTSYKQCCICMWVASRYTSMISSIINWHPHFLVHHRYRRNRLSARTGRKLLFHWIMDVRYLEINLLMCKCIRMRVYIDIFS